MFKTVKDILPPVRSGVLTKLMMRSDIVSALTSGRMSRHQAAAELGAPYPSLCYALSRLGIDVPYAIGNLRKPHPVRVIKVRSAPVEGPLVGPIPSGDGAWYPPQFLGRKSGESDHDYLTRRANDIREGRANGRTLKELARDWGVTRERIRQIAGKIGAVKPHEVRAAMRLADTLERRAERTRQAAAKALLMQRARILVERDGLSITRALRQVGIDRRSHGGQYDNLGWDTRFGRWRMAGLRPKIVADYRAGVSVRDTSTRLRVSKGAIYRVLHEAGIRPVRARSRL